METKLCPSTKNELGKGIIPERIEAEFLAEGYIFACKVPGTRVTTWVVCQRPIADAVTDGELDSPRFRRTTQPVKAPVST